MKQGILMAVFVLAACGYKGDLYLPRDHDKARFGVIQTGIDFTKPNGAKNQPNLQPASKENGAKKE